jgi:putative transferase (TIGR04331 family)
MNKEKRYLITTADERTWKFDCPVIFLGDWCRIYNRRHIWKNMDAIVAAPYGIGVASKDADHLEVRRLEERFIHNLSNALNLQHGVTHDQRFWQILLGHWVHRYVDVMINRVKTLQQCLQAYQISGTTVYSNDHYSLATSDSYSAIWAFDDDRWNNSLNARILHLLGEVDFSLEVVIDCSSKGFHFKSLVATSSFKTKAIKWVYQAVSKMARFFIRDNDAFIISSYLPVKEVLKLELALGQCPQLWSSPKFDVIETPDHTLRKMLTKRILRKSGYKIEDILTEMLFELLPVCYLEGFVNLTKLTKQQSWPKFPKFIFTSNSFDSNEVFKLWAACKVASGSKYFTGQHGNNYGTYRYMNPSIEELTADKFITWGWSDGLRQHTPAFIFKTAAKKEMTYNPKGGLLLIELPLFHRINTWDTTYEFADYFEAQQVFVQNLTSRQKQELTIRLHPGWRNMKWCEEARWQSTDASLKIDLGMTGIRDLIRHSRLVVHSYDSTGILETLSQNIPTLAFWQNGFDHLRESAKPYYQLLVDVGIVHLTSESVAGKVNEVWDDIDGWWEQSELQDARKQFCERYARVEHQPVSKLLTILA